jgi:hypothetical protein
MQNTHTFFKIIVNFTVILNPSTYFLSFIAQIVANFTYYVLSTVQLVFRFQILLNFPEQVNEKKHFVVVLFYF